MDDRTLKRTVKALFRATEFNFVISIGKKNRLSEYLISINPGEITHLMGLDHLSGVLSIVEHNNDKKIQFIKDISNGNKKFSDLQQGDVDMLNLPLDKTYNPQKKTCYTLMDRIEKLKNINVFLSRAYKGVMYDWKKSFFPIKTPNGETRTVDISADYMLAIPSNIPGEKLYLFMYVDKYNKKPITKLNIHSAFFDGVDLTQSQREMGKILKEDKINIKSPEKSRNLIDLTIENNTQSTPKVMKITYNNGNIQGLTNPDGTVTATTKDQTDESFALPLLVKIKQFFTEKIPRAFDIIKLKNEISELKEYISKREDQLDNALNEIEDNKLLLDEKDKQIEDLTAENAGLKKENSQLKETVAQLSEKIEVFEKQKQPVLTASKSKGSFRDNLVSFPDKVRTENAAKSQQQNKPNLNPTDKPKH